MSDDFKTKLIGDTSLYKPKLQEKDLERYHAGIDLALSDKDSVSKVMFVSDDRSILVIREEMKLEEVQRRWPKMDQLAKRIEEWKKI